MAEQSAGEKTLPASEEKKRKAREDGNIARSQELTAAWTMLVALLALRYMGRDILSQLVGAAALFFGNAGSVDIGVPNIQHLAAGSIWICGRMVLPFMVAMLLAGLTINIVQVGFLFTVKPMTPKLSKLNPITGMGRFFKLRSLVELIKSLLKLIVIGTVVYYTMWGRAGEIVCLGELAPRLLVPAIGGMVLTIWWRVVLVMIVLGLLDYAYQRWQRERDLMMTVQEAKEETRRFEGDPRLKARIRQVQRQIAMQRMMSDVPQADVIITNPIRYAVALRYDMDEMEAPVVLAKGARLVAGRIREIAVENGVPIVQKADLAHTLYRTVEVGQPIPEKLFSAVAEVLAYVYRIDRRAEKVRERERTAGRLVQAFQ